MTILKEKSFSDKSDVRQVAGDRQEKDVAFYLRRAFKDDENILVLNDYRFVHNGEAAQIDHLVVHRTGFIVIESKSIFGEVKVNAQGEWSRSYKGQWSGMPSPIRQAELQMELLRDFLGDNVEQFLGKMLFGKVQQRVRFREWNVLCTVSSSCILHRKGMPSALSKQVVKSEFIADEVQKIGGYSRFDLLSGKACFSLKEMQQIGEFLLQHHQPKQESASQTDTGVSVNPSSAKLYVPDSAPSAATAETSSVQPAVPKTSVEGTSVKPDIIGLCCKKCGSERELTALYGQYGYYVKCGICGTNTAMKIACPACGSRKTRVRKEGNKYWLQCECSPDRLLYTQS